MSFPLAGRVTVCIWVISSSSPERNYTCKIAHDCKPEDIIAETIRKRTESMALSSSQQQRCVEEYKGTYVLKVCGCSEYIMDDYPISQFKVGGDCRGVICRFVIAKLSEVVVVFMQSTAETSRQCL